MMEIKPDCNPECQQETVECKEAPAFVNVKLWVLDYENVSDPSYRGLAVIAAHDVRQAERIFYSDSRHNGNPSKIRIGKIEQIPFPVVPDLIMETYFKIFE